MEKETGVIYCLTSPNGKNYIGQTWDIEDRWKKYKKLNCKPQVKLYYALLKYGPENFIFSILESSNSQEELDKKECFWIAKYKTQDDEYGYNIRDGGSRGKHSLESRIKISKSRTGMKFSQEHIKNMSLARIGKKRNKDVVDKIAKSNTGKKRSEEFKNTISKMKKGTKLSEETKRKIGDGNRNKKLSEETKRKISENNANKIYKYHIINTLTNEVQVVYNLVKFCKDNPSFKYCNVYYCAAHGKLYDKIYIIKKELL